jgi:peroxiredoxin
MSFDPTKLPPDLPIPADDGSARHLVGVVLPELAFTATEGSPLNLARLARDTLVLFIHPAIARPDRPLPKGWDETPGARGCTPQSCGFRDRYGDFVDLGVTVAGLSSQTHKEQIEAADRLKLPFPLLSDPQLRLAQELELPTFQIGGMTLYKRLTLIARNGRIVKTFYPVFPPDQNASEVAQWLSKHPAPASDPA